MKTIRKIATALFLAGIAFAADAYDINYYASSSRLSTGKWVKIKVTRTGMQQITHEQLKEWGFDDPDKVSVFGYGGNVLTSEFSASYSDDLPAQPVYRGDDKIIFYGESDARILNYETVTNTYIRRNTCATAGYYLVTDAYPGASTDPELKGAPTSTTDALDHHCNSQFAEEEVFNPTKAGVRFFGTDFKQKPEQTFAFKAPYPYEAGTSSYRGRVNFRWVARMADSQREKLNYTTDYDTSVGQNSSLTSPSTNECHKTADGYISVITRTDGNSLYTTTFSAPTVGYEYAAMDYVAFSYHRRNRLYDIDQLPMVFNSVAADCNVTFDKANADIRFWNVNNTFAPFAYNTLYNENRRTITFAFESGYTYSANGHAYVIAFDPSKDMYPVEYAGDVENQNLHGMPTPEMLIITSSPYLPYAEELARAHRDIQGMEVLVVDQEKIFNEFSSGTPSVMGYRRFIKMFHDRAPGQFKYVLLYGGGSFDNRHILYGDQSYLLTYQCETPAYLNYITKAFSADSYFGMLDDGFTLNGILSAQSDVAVGRLPVLSISNAVDVNKKLIGCLNNPPLDNSRNCATLLADAGDTGDPNAHQIQVEEIASAINALSPTTTVTKPYCDLYPWVSGESKDSRSLLLRALNGGQAFLGYAGHGSSSGISGSNLYYKSDVISNTYKTPPFVFLSTCNAMSFDQNGNGLGEEFILVPDGGAIGIVASCRDVYQTHNQSWYMSFVDKFFTATPGMTQGDVYREARNHLLANHTSDAVLNALSYNFMGDPAMPMYIPRYKVTTTMVSGTEIADDATPVTVYPLAENSIGGQITDSDGNIVSDFNGTIYISVYDAPVSVKTLGQVSGNSPMEVTLDEKCISQAIAQVADGRFSTSIIIPEASIADKASRIVYYAVSDDKANQAAGACNNMIIAEYDETKAIPDTEAPIISQMYLDTPDNTDGAVIDNAATLYAEIEPDASGLCITDSRIENNARVIIDGNRSYSSSTGTLTFNADGSYLFEFPLTELSDGRHSLTLIISDNAGNRTERTIYFTVINRNAQATLIVEESPARTEATFTLNHDFKSEPSGRLIIEDASGNAIYSKADVRFPYTWDLNDADGNAVADGVYHCYAILNGEKQYGGTAKTKLIVVKQ